MRVNAQPMAWRPGLTLADVRRQAKPDADIVILNGFPVAEEQIAATAVGDADEIVLIRRGEVPSAEELFAFMSARHTPGVAERLASACVGIAGAGGLGSNVAHALARVGVGRLVIADFDVVEPSNLNRQAYRVEQIGQSKVEALAGDLAAINPCVQVSALAVRLNADNISRIFADCAVVVECFDLPEQKQLLVENVLLRLPHAKVVAASGLAGIGDANTIQTRRVADRLWVVGDGISAATFGQGLMAPRVLIAAGHQANAVVRILLGKE